MSAQEWQSQGIDFQVAGNIPIAIDGNDIVYLCTRENDVLVVKRSVNGIWENVGQPLLDADSFGSINLRIDPTGIPYVAYEDDSQSDKLTVRRFINGGWELVGNQGFSANRVPNMTFEIDSNGVP